MVMGKTLDLHDFQRKQTTHCMALSQPKWREVPFHRYVLNSNRKDVVKRKFHIHNQIFNYH
jgi:hypothetical protein